MTEKLSLIAISQEIENVIQEAIENEGELDQEKLARLEEIMISKVDAVADFQNGLSSRISALEEMQAKISERIDFYKKKELRFHDYIKFVLESSNKESLEGEFYQIKKRKPVKKVEILDENIIPIDFINTPKPKPVIMVNEIAKELKAGKEIAGTRLVDGKASLTFKLK